jgi:hypothetical protein
MGQSPLAAIGFKITSPFVLASIHRATILVVLLIACEVMLQRRSIVQEISMELDQHRHTVAIVLWILFTGLFAYIFITSIHTTRRTLARCGDHPDALALSHSPRGDDGAAINAVLRQMHEEDATATPRPVDDQENTEASQTTTETNAISTSFESSWLDSLKIIKIVNIIKTINIVKIDIGLEVCLI